MSANNNKKTSAKVVSLSASKSLETIKQDLDVLKSDIVELGLTVKSDGLKKIEEAASEIQIKIEDLKKEGGIEFERIQHYIQEKPTQSIGIAFAAGVVLTALLGRR